MAFKNLVNGFRVFKANYIAGNSAELFEKLVTEGQSPETLVIACSDSRIDPAILTQSKPGDLFSVRNVAAMVPAYDCDGHAHGTSAAIEYAVTALKVKHIIVLGHALCGGIRALAESPENLETENNLISRWISISKEARDAVRSIMPGLPIDEKSRYLEQASILVSMQNLLTFPSVKDAVEKGALDIHGWYFDMPNGKLLAYDSDVKKYRSILANDSGVPAPAVTAKSCSCIDSVLSLTDFLNTVRDGESTTKQVKIKRSRRAIFTTWLRRLSYAFTAAAGVAVGAAAEDLGSIVLFF